MPADKVTRIFTHMDFDTDQLHQLWEDIKELDEQGAVWNYKIAKELEMDEYDWDKGYMKKRILPAMKNALDSHGIATRTSRSIPARISSTWLSTTRNPRGTASPLPTRQSRRTIRRATRHSSFAPSKACSHRSAGIGGTFIENSPRHES